MTIYTDLAQALAFVKSLTNISDRDVILNQKLKASAGKLKAECEIEGEVVAAGTTIFRFYYVAAKALQQDRQIQLVKQADGVTFSGMAVSIDSFMDEQLAIDTAFDLDVPKGFVASTDLDGSMSASAGIPVMSILVG